MDISKWNYIMDSFQKILGYDKGTTEVLITKRFSIIGGKDINTLNDRETKYLTHILRKRYKEILDEKDRRKNIKRIKRK
tara:strand:- start:427 stop:663 length:237 start_codon:yes stop_codon:yes gene_type:complete